MSAAKLFLVVATLLMIFWPGIHHHREMAKDPYFVPYDAAQYIPAFFKFEVKDPIPTTYAKEYYLNAVCPVLYKWSLRFGAQFGDVRRFQLGMMYLAYAVFIAVLGRLGWLLGGAALSFAVVAMTISAWIFIGLGFIGGAPRMYGYPLMSLILYALIMDRPNLLASAVVLGGLLYPIIAVIGGLCLAGWMLLRPLSRKGLVAQWGLSRRVTTVALVGVLTFAGLVPLMLGSEPYGRRVVDSDIASYPEAGPDGNYRLYDQLPYKLFGYEFVTYLVGPLYSHGDPIVPWLNVHETLDQMTLLFVLAVTGITVLFVIVRGMRAGLNEDQRWCRDSADRLLHRLRHAARRCLARVAVPVYTDALFHVFVAFCRHVAIPLVTLQSSGSSSAAKVIAPSPRYGVFGNCLSFSPGFRWQRKRRIHSSYGQDVFAATIRGHCSSAEGRGPRGLARRRITES